MIAIKAAHLPQLKTELFSINPQIISGFQYVQWFLSDEIAERSLKSLIELGIMPENLPQQHPIVFFDGVCGLCNKLVDYSIKADKKHYLRYAPLQGETAARLLGSNIDLDTVIFYKDGLANKKSTAILKMGMAMGGIRKLGAIGFIIPRFIRDFFYDIVAQNRYKFFGKKESCRLPTPAERELFLP